MTLGEKQEHFARAVVALVQKAWEMGYQVRLGEVQRPLEMQQIYVNTGRSKTMDSQHIKKLAIDLVLLKNDLVCTHEQIQPLGAWWEDQDPSFRWGGSWRGLIQAKKSSFVDAPHFEMQG